MDNYITVVDKLSEQSRHHRRHRIAIHKGLWHFASMDAMSQLTALSKTLGFTFDLIEDKQIAGGARLQVYSMSHILIEGGYFWNVEELPEGAKPIKALSNGSLTDCYFTNDGKIITMFRPNPNAKNVYKPLSMQDHIGHENKYGIY